VAAQHRGGAGGDQAVHERQHAAVLQTRDYFGEKIGLYFAFVDSI
jgi:hypothetical protein